jgi:hypothetical protein
MLGGSSALEVRKGKGQDGGSVVKRAAQVAEKLSYFSRQRLHGGRIMAYMVSMEFKY